MRKFLIAFALLGLFTACSDDDDQDTTPPSVVLKSPQKDSGYTVGKTLPFEVEFTDDTELKRYKIDIHSAAGHEHSMGRKTSAESWSFQKEYTLDPVKNAVKRDTLAIPENAEPGEYHFVVFCTDAAGNESIAYTHIELVAAE